MGVKVDRAEFSDEDHIRFAERLDDCLAALGELLRRPGFGVGEPTIGAELELFLVDRTGRPLPENQAVLDNAGEPRLTLEIDRFNLELNPTPLSLSCRPFEVLGREMAELRQAVRAAAQEHGGREAAIGILPTLRDSDLRRACITDAPRYRALDVALRRLRQEPLR